MTVGKMTVDGNWKIVDMVIEAVGDFVGETNIEQLLSKFFAVTTMSLGRLGISVVLFISSILPIVIVAFPIIVVLFAIVFVLAIIPNIIISHLVIPILVITWLVLLLILILRVLLIVFVLALILLHQLIYCRLNGFS